MIYEQVTEELKQRFQQARAVAVLTGAGVSAESGVPTFRGGGGAAVWKGLPAERLASPEMLKSDPVMLWEWYNYRREIISRASPNPAHRALAEWEQSFPTFTLITQNVDELHRAAGSRNVLELHGSLWRVRCMECGARSENRDVPLAELPPRCQCGGVLRPEVVLFGEMLPPDVYARASMAAASCDLFFVVGTSAVVYPAASLPVSAKQHRAFVIEVNPEPTPVSEYADATILGRAGDVLPGLVRET
jgi:NAD-dependent deacetylase